MSNDVHAFDFQDVSFSINGNDILKGITGYFAKGRITSLVGPSGAGKTTMLKLCNSLLSPSSGTILFNGKALDEIDPVTLRRKVSIVLQNSPMINGTVYDNLALPCILQGQALRQEEAVRILELVGLPEAFLSHDANALSGGQQQKVSIARALSLNRSSVLLLDEITSALDRSSVREIEKLLRTIQQSQKRTIIWITHNLEQAMRMSDYVWVMMDGRLVQTGSISILTTPTDERVQDFIEGKKS